MIMLLLAVAQIVGCSRQTDGPPKLVVDRNECTRCKMLISDTRYASALKSKKYMVYDDIGCMLDDMKIKSSLHVEELWFRDFRTDEWISAEQSLFFVHNSRKTPMGYGYIAVRGDTTKPLPVIADVSYLGTIEQLRAEHIKGNTPK
jgi:copper chaperone NosL